MELKTILFIIVTNLIFAMIINVVVEWQKMKKKIKFNWLFISLYVIFLSYLGGLIAGERSYTDAKYFLILFLLLLPLNIVGLVFTNVFLVNNKKRIVNSDNVNIINNNCYNNKCSINSINKYNNINSINYNKHVNRKV